MENVNIKHNGYQYADQTQVTPKGVCNTCRQNSQEKIWYFLSEWNQAFTLSNLLANWQSGNCI